MLNPLPHLIQIYMKLYNTFSQWDSNKTCVVSIGMFDGVHIGHKLVIRQTIDLAKQNNIP